MPKPVFVKKARKAKRKHGIKVGMSYYHWKFPRCEKQYSLTPPKPSQLTRSEYLKSVYQVRELYEGISRTSVPSVIVSEIEQVISNLTEIREGLQTKADGVSAKFPTGCPTLDLLLTRGEACDKMLDQLESVKDSVGAAQDVEASETDRVSWVTDRMAEMTWEIS